MLNCSCEKGFPVIATLRSHDAGCFLAGHHCSHCGTHLFEMELKPGEKLIATDNIGSDDGRHVIPKGRVMRITGFADLAMSATGFLFCGLLAAGAFPPAGFSAVWEIEKLFDLSEAPDKEQLASNPNR
jgi:hypothetical protein